jgi:hypothetical protein
MLLVGGLVQAYFSYHESAIALARLQHEKAAFAASAIEQFIRDVDRQVRWALQPAFAIDTATLDQRRNDYHRLLRQTPEVIEVSFLDTAGRIRLEIGRFSFLTPMLRDYAQEPWFLEARSDKTSFSPMYLKDGSPFMRLARVEFGPDGGVLSAQVSLKYVWDVVSRVGDGQAGSAYVVDTGGHLVAHSDYRLVSRQRDVSALSQVQLALADAPYPEPLIVRDLRGDSVLTAYAPITPPGWFLIVEQPVDKIQASVYGAILRAGLLALVGLALTLVASLALARTTASSG